MTEEEKRVLKLTQKLPDRLDYIKVNWESVIDNEWDAHHAGDIILSDSIEEYQVLRQFDVEIQPCHDFGNMTPEMMKWYENNDEDYQGLVDKFFNGDPYEASYTHEEGEYIQRWINLKTGKITVLGKIFKPNPTYCDLEGKWEVVNKKRNGKRANAFYKRFKYQYGEGLYEDMTINPLLTQYGYEPINALDWCIECGSETEYNRSDSANLVYNEFRTHNWENFLYTFAQGLNPCEQLIKIIGLKDYIYSKGLEAYLQEGYITACKIAKRHNYIPSDKTIWRDTITNLIRLEKDIHNPKYVCPENLLQLHNTVLKQYQKERDKIKLKEDMMKAIAENEKYIKVCKRFLDIILKSKNVVLRPLQSVTEFLEEGNAMHHCVFTNGYYKQAHTLILSARDHENNRLATIELDTNSWQIKQIRAKCNHNSPFEKEIKKLINSNINVFKMAKAA